MSVGAVGSSTGGYDWMAGASITSECNGSGVRKVSKGPYLAGASAPGLLEVQGAVAL